jgi:hypothetical protein
MISVHREARSSLFCEAMTATGETVPRKAMSGKPAKMVATSEMHSPATEMATAAAKAAASSTMAAASSTMGDRCDWRERHNAGQN